MTDLDVLPFPARDLVQMERYREAWKTAHGFFSLNAVASRGCPYRCNWCAKPIYGDSFHLRSAERVAEEMRVLKEKWDAEHLWFADDIFGLKARWVQELAEWVEHFKVLLENPPGPDIVNGNQNGVGVAPLPLEQRTQIGVFQRTPG